MEQHFQTIEVGCFLGERFLVTHHAKQVKGIFDARGKIAQNPSVLLNSPDGLLHHIVDAMTDHYTPAIEAFKNRIENTDNSPEEIKQLHIEAAMLLQIGKLQQTVLTRLAQENLPFIAHTYQVYYQNVQTHQIRAVQFAESCVAHLEAHLETHRTQAANLQVQNMRILIATMTTFATAIFLTVFMKPNISNLISTSNETWSLISMLSIIILSGGVAGLFKFKKWF